MDASNYTIGIVYILLTVFIWTAASLCTQYLEKDMNFDAPFVFTYISTSLFSINLPAYWLYGGFAKMSRKHGKNSDQNLASAMSAFGDHMDAREGGNTDTKEYLRYYQLDGMDDLLPKVFTDSVLDCLPVTTTPPLRSIPWLLQPLPDVHTNQELLQVAMLLMPLFFVGNFFYNTSLMHTSISSCVVITNLNGAFTLLFSYLVGAEEVTIVKVLGVLLCFAGVVLVSWADKSDEGTGDYIYGDVCALIGAVAYGLYTTAVKVKIPDSSHKVSMTLLFGLVGILNAIVLLPAIVFLYMRSDVPTLTGPIATFIVGEEVFDTVIANYLYAKATVLTTPSVAAVGESLTIPMSLMADALLLSNSPDLWTCGGGLLVAAGFLLIALGP